VISLTARPREPTSSRTVMEYETLGAMATMSSAFPWQGSIQKVRVIQTTAAGPLTATAPAGFE
jgi:hypothetical protein